MKIHDCTQGSSEWLRLRMGIPTASEFHRIITPKTCKQSAQADGYMNDLLAELILGRPIEKVLTAAMDHGKHFEAEARDYYSLLRGVDVKQVGFITSDDGLYGCSPDGLVGEGLAEFKCPKEGTHVGYLFGNGAADDYRCQLQGMMYITDRPWVDIVSYCPGLPEVIIRVERDEEFIEKLAVLLGQFLLDLGAKHAIAKERGWIKPAEIETNDGGGLGITDDDIERLIAEKFPKP